MKRALMVFGLAMSWISTAWAVELQTPVKIGDSEQAVQPMEFASNIPEADGLAFDAKGDLFVAAETWAGEIYRVSRDGKVSVFAKGIPSADGLAIAPDGKIYVTSEVMKGRVAVVDGDGKVQTLVRLRNPEGMAFDGEGVLHVTEDVKGGRVVRIRNGQVETVAEGLDRPENLAFDASGNLYVTETGSGKIIRLESGGKRRLLTDGIEKPDGIFYSERFAGLFVTQDKPKDARVYHVGLDGKISSVLEGLYEPQGIAADSAGDLYISEQGKSRIIRLPMKDVRIE